MASEIKSIALNDTLYDIKDTKARLDIAEESANRTSADSELQTAINEESANRTSADSKLQTAINKESANRTSADNELQTAIANVSNLALIFASNLNFSLANENVNRVLFNYFTSATENAPVATTGFVMTHCISTTSAVQTAYCGKQIFTRTLSGTTWSDWVATWNTEES